MKSLIDYYSPTGQVEGLLFNCSSPEVITAAMSTLNKEVLELGVSVRIGAYANGFTKVSEENANPSDSKILHPSIGNIIEFCLTLSQGY